jgi:hypothetical protein
MPMKTTFDSRAGTPAPRAPSRAAAAADRTCSTISAVDMLRCSPPWPVAQNGQAIPQPAWLEMQTVARSE